MEVLGYKEIISVPPYKRRCNYGTVPDEKRNTRCPLERSSLKAVLATPKCLLNECTHADRKGQGSKINPNTKVMGSELMRILNLIHKAGKELTACFFL